MKSHKIKHSISLYLTNFSFLILAIVIFSNIASAQSNLDQGIALYEKGDYTNAIKILEKDNENISSLYYLGLAYEKNDDKKSAEAAYLSSIEKATKLVIKQLRKNSKVGAEEFREQIKTKYGRDIDTAFLAFGRYGQLNPEIYESIDWRNKFQVLSIYAQNVVEADRFYFSNEVTSKLKITSKSFAGFTKEARRIGATGNINVLVGFMKDGTIGMAIPLKELGYGLTESAVNAAKEIKFEPAEKDKNPVNTVAIINYDFRIF